MVEPTSANSSSNKEDQAEVGQNASQSAPPKSSGVHTEILGKHYEAFGGTDSQIYP